MNSTIGKRKVWTIRGQCRPGKFTFFGPLLVAQKEDFPARKSPAKDQGASPVLRRANRKRKSTASYTDMSKGSGSKKKKSYPLDKTTILARVCLGSLEPRSKPRLQNNMNNGTKTIHRVRSPAKALRRCFWQWKDGSRPSLKNLVKPLERRPTRQSSIVRVLRSLSLE